MKVLPACSWEFRYQILPRVMEQRDRGGARARTVELEYVVCVSGVGLPQSLDVLEEGLLVEMRDATGELLLRNAVLRAVLSSANEGERYGPGEETNVSRARGRDDRDALSVEDFHAVQDKRRMPALAAPSPISFLPFTRKDLDRWKRERERTRSPRPVCPSMPVPTSPPAHSTGRRCTARRVRRLDSRLERESRRTWRDVAVAEDAKAGV